jgi:hypothetical protein
MEGGEEGGEGDGEEEDLAVRAARDAGDMDDVVAFFLAEIATRCYLYTWPQPTTTPPSYHREPHDETPAASARRRDRALPFGRPKVEPFAILDTQRAHTHNTSH